MTETEKVLEKYGDLVVAQMKRILLSNRKRATGNLINSIGYKIKNNEIIIITAPYGKYVDEGRRKGATPPPIKAILNWIKVKRIPIDGGRTKTIVARSKKQPQNKQMEQMAYAIARGISKNEIKATNFTKPIAILKSAKFKSDLKKAITADLKKQLKK